MFISNKNYRDLLNRVAALEKGITVCDEDGITVYEDDGYTPVRVSTADAVRRILTYMNMRFTRRTERTQLTVIPGSR